MSPTADLSPKESIATPLPAQKEKHAIITKVRNGKKTPSVEDAPELLSSCNGTQLAPKKRIGAATTISKKKSDGTGGSGSLVICRNK